MLEIQAIDELERMVTIAELQALTIEAAFHPDEVVLASTERLERTIGNSLAEHQPHTRSAFIPHLFALKVRIGHAVERMRKVTRQRRAPPAAI
jgi:hypothetical protein